MFLITFNLVMIFMKNVIVTKAANILAHYPCASISHQIVFRPITLELLRRGHQVTVITTDPMFSKDSRPANLTEIDVHDVSYKIVRETFTGTVTGKKEDLVNQAQIIMNNQLLFFEEQLKLEEVKDLLQKQEKDYDLILLEALLFPALGWTYKFKAPTILISSLGAFPGNYETVGVSTNPFLYPDFFRQRVYNLTMWEKVTEFLNHIRIKNIIKNNDEKVNKLLQKIFGDDIPKIDHLKNNVDMMFLNINPIYEGNYPVPPSVIHMGGLHQKPSKKLPKDLQNYLDASNDGVIYFSFGTNVKPSFLPPEKIAIFIKVFSQLSYNVVWKWDSENFKVKSRNIKIFQWLPQADLLKHPNVKLFITQGGLQSTDEAITGGVPLIGIPMLVDQWYNVEKYVQHKIGVRLELEDLTENQLKEAILEVAEEESYRKNIIRLRSLMQDQPQTPLERAIWWIEYVLRHGGAKHFRAPAANMSWSKFLELELVVVFLFVGLVSFVLIYAAIKVIICLVFNPLTASIFLFIHKKLRDNFMLYLYSKLKIYGAGMKKKKKN